LVIVEEQPAARHATAKNCQRLLRVSIGRPLPQTAPAVNRKNSPGAVRARTCFSRGLCCCTWLRSCSACWRRLGRQHLLFHQAAERLELRVFVDQHGPEPLRGGGHE